MEIIRYWEIICRRKWVFIIVFSFIFIAVAVGSNIATPIYEAKAKVLIKPSESGSSLMATLGLSSNKLSIASSTAYETDITLTTIRPLLEKLIDKLHLKDKDGKKLTPDKLTKSSIANKILHRPYIEVDQYEDSDLLEITANSPNSEEAAMMANELAQLYIDWNLENTRKDYKAVRLFIENKMINVKEIYNKALLDRKDFMIEGGTVNLEEEIKDLLQYMIDLKNDYKNNEIVIGQANESIALIEKQLTGKGYTSSSLVNSLETKLIELLLDMDIKKVELSNVHPDVVTLDKQIDTVNKLIKERMNDLLSEKKISIAPVYEELVKNLKDAYINKKTGEIKREVLQTYIDKYQTELMRYPFITARYSELDLLLTVNQDVYKNLMEYLTQVGIAESITFSNYRLVELAEKPDKSSFPNAALNYILGFLLGLFWGVFIVFTTEYMDNTIKNSGDLKNYRFTFLGDVPRFKKGALVSETDPNDPVYESYRKINANINFAKLDNPPKKILISSINPKDGNSTTTANLGIVLANEGKKVLLIDTDLRRPNIHNLFGLQNTEGLTSLLMDKIEIRNAVRKTGINGLEVLTSGTTPADPAALIKSKKMQEVISKLEEMYDIILFDSAPLLIKNDAISLMNYMDGLVVVSRSKMTTHNAVSKTEEILENAKVVPVGIILNCI